MDYEKKYKEALERARIYRNNAKAVEEYSAVARYENIFPELRENEDEKIRKEIIEYLTVTRERDLVGHPERQRWITYLEKQKEQKPIKVYRVENEDKQKGLWRKFDGTWEPLFDMLTDGLCRNLPMEDSDLYRAEGKKWFASAPSRETLQKWFSKRDLEELTAAGFTISEFEVTNYKKVSEFEYIFTRDSIINRTYLTVSDIYPEQKPAEWSEEDKDMLNSCISSIEEAKENRYAYKETDGDTSYDHEIAWLKRLRPSWKPSEGHLSALLAVFNDPNNIGSQTCQLALTDLYEQLKKL